MDVNIGHPCPPLRRDARCGLPVIRNRLALEEWFVIQPANLRGAPSIYSTARSSHAPRIERYLRRHPVGSMRGSADRRSAR